MNLQRGAMTVNALRGIVSFGAVGVLAALIGVWLSVESRAQAPDRTAITGAWTLNLELSDKPGGRGARDDREGDDGARRRGGSGRGGGMGGGIRGGGMGRGAMGGGRADPDDMARMRDAMRDVMNPPEHLTITQTETMILITSQDGRTTRLSPDGKKIKDEHTRVERKTKWDGAKLVSEISGLGPGKIIETYIVEGEPHRLNVAVQMEGGRAPRSLHRVYDADAR
jgi:hypothetical protein